MSTAPYMPFRGHELCLTFNLKVLHTLPRYFADLDDLFAICSVTSNTTKKQYVTYYIDIDTSDLWKYLPSHDPAVPYTNFVSAIIALYPGADDDHKYTIANMESLVSQQLQIAIQFVDDLAEYYRPFLTISWYFLSKNRISEGECNRAFVRGF
jgi:hypothetical protein